MAYRPYPNADRARHQLDRHDDETPPLTGPRPMTPFERAVVDGATAAVRAAAPTLTAMVEGFRRRAVDDFPVDAYRLSTRPGVVGGGS